MALIYLLPGATVFILFNNERKVSYIFLMIHLSRFCSRIKHLVRINLASAGQMPHWVSRIARKCTRTLLSPHRCAHASSNSRWSRIIVKVVCCKPDTSAVAKRTQWMLLAKASASGRVTLHMRYRDPTTCWRISVARWRSSVHNSHLSVWLQRCGWYKTTLVTPTKTDASRSVVLFIVNSKPNDFKKLVKTINTLQTDVTSLSADVTGWQDTTVEMENIILLIVVPSENNAAFLLSLSGSCIALDELVKRCSFDWSVTIGQTSGAGALAIS